MLSKRKHYAFFICIFLFCPLLLASNGNITYAEQSEPKITPLDENPKPTDEEFPNLTPKNISELMGLEQMWSMGYNGNGTKVAVLDTGIDDTHPELSGRILNGYTRDFTNKSDGMDYEGHGTVVAGILGATGIDTNDGKFQGVAPNVSLINIKVMDGNGEGKLEWVIKGINYANYKNMDVISLSLGAESTAWKYLKEPIKNAVENGSVVVTASGNDGADVNTVSSPGDILEGITVGSCSHDGYMLSFSSAGPTDTLLCKPDIVAPGAYIIGPASSENNYENEIIEQNGIEYIPMSGTSMSTPIVSGMAAILLEATQAKPSMIKVALMSSATDLGYSQYRQGYGIPNATKAYELITNNSWDPVLFLPNQLPDEVVGKNNLYGMNITVLAGKKYENIRFNTDLPLIVPTDHELNGHFTFKLKADKFSISEKEVGSIRIQDDDSGETIAEMKLSISAQTIIKTSSLMMVAFFAVILASVSSFMMYNYAKKRAMAREAGCGLLDFDCQIESE